MGSFTNNVLVSLVVSFRSLFASRMRRAALVSAALIIVLVVGTYAYLQSLPPAAGPRVSLVSPPLEFSMELDKAEFQQGENVTVRLYLKNVSNETIEVGWGSYFGGELAGSTYDIAATDVNGSVVFQWSSTFIFLPTVVERTLEPGEEFFGFHIWTQEMNWVDPPQVFVPKGVYHIRGLTRRFSLTVDGQTTVLSLQTPTITITINS